MGCLARMAHHHQLHSCLATPATPSMTLPSPPLRHPVGLPPLREIGTLPLPWENCTGSRVRGAREIRAILTNAPSPPPQELLITQLSIGDRQGRLSPPSPELALASSYLVLGPPRPLLPDGSCPWRDRGRRPRQPPQLGVFSPTSWSVVLLRPPSCWEPCHPHTLNTPHKALCSGLHLSPKPEQGWSPSSPPHTSGSPRPCSPPRRSQVGSQSEESYSEPLPGKRLPREGAH